MSNQLLNEDMSARLLAFRRNIIEQAKTQFKGMNDSKKEVIKSIIEEMLKPLDNTVGGTITEDLIRKFGDFGFKVDIAAYAKPFTKIDANNPYRYIVNRVVWKDGPNVMQVHYYLNDNFPRFMKDREYDPKIFHRRISNIERRLKQSYKPIEIRDRQFAPVDIFISQVVYKEDDKVVDARYIIQPVDEMLKYTDIKNNNVNALSEIEAPTLAGALELLQAQIEECFYSQRYSPKYKVISRKLVAQEQETNPDFSGDQVDDSSNSSSDIDDIGNSDTGNDDSGNDDQSGAGEEEVLVEQDDNNSNVDDGSGDPMLDDNSSSSDDGSQ